MNRPRTPSERELFALLADRALFGLGPSARLRLARGLAGRPEIDADSIDRTAALLLLGAATPSEPLPDAIRAKIRAAAERFFSHGNAAGDTPFADQDGSPP